MAFGGQEFTAIVTTVGGYGWIALPVGVGDVINVVVQFTADASRMSSGPPGSQANTAGKTEQLNDSVLPAFVGVSPAVTAHAPQGVAQFGPGAEGPAPDGTYDVVIFTT
jgi:hypothetical protein